MNSGTKSSVFGNMSFGLMDLKLKCLTIMTNCTFVGKSRKLDAREHHPNSKVQGWQHHVVGCFTAVATGALHKLDGVMRNTRLNQNLKTSDKTLKLQIDNIPQHSTRSATKWLKTTKSMFWSSLHKVCVSKVGYRPDQVTQEIMEK
ncbi:hypothetical protein CHARACLAT_015966 [Characodon lateralis]|uniref:Uncharacterized protein n=1 Tax=Characodon lateralis TaxID=208331 RepID=A0ABU7E3Y0_9TELE|nr:hypothetical protein [Characodon lateralis]